MASILDRYGIKEVADVTFYEIDENGLPGKPVLYLDTLKVSTIEQTAETAEARGGKGNPMLVSWDFGKDINLSIEDALFSPKSMAIMLGNGKVVDLNKDAEGNLKEEEIEKTARARVVNGTFKFMADVYDASVGATRKEITVTAAAKPALSDGLTFKNAYDELGNELTEDTLPADGYVFIRYTQKINGRKIEISADSFPGTYYVTGDTYARSDVTGKDQFFRFIVHKAKMQAENTITLEAEGDPSVFNMSLRVLRPDNGVMMDLIQYELEGEVTENVENGENP